MKKKKRGGAPLKTIHTQKWPPWSHNPTGAGSAINMERGDSSSSSGSSLLTTLLASPRAAALARETGLDPSTNTGDAADDDVEVTVQSYTSLGLLAQSDTAIAQTSKRPDESAEPLTPAAFEMERVIGRGAFGRVFLVKHRATGQYYAMKVLRKASLTVLNTRIDGGGTHGSFKDLRNTLTERTILEAIQHPFIVRLHFAFQTDDKLYLVLHYGIGGELFYWLEKQRMFDEPTAVFYAAEILCALAHLHELHIIYRDLKPENVLLDGTGHVLLTDFGLSKVALESRTVCGTADYMAPEIVQELPYDKAVDFWSLGILVFDMLTGRTPFHDRQGGRKKVMDNIVHKKLQLPHFLSPFSKDLLTRLLRKKPAQRLGSGAGGLERLRGHGFFRRIDWAQLERLEVPVPFVPPVGGPGDTGNFRPSFTSLAVSDALAAASAAESDADDAAGLPGAIEIPRDAYRAIRRAAPWRGVSRPAAPARVAAGEIITTVRDYTGAARPRERTVSGGRPFLLDEEALVSASAAHSCENSSGSPCSSISASSLTGGNGLVQVNLDDLFRGFSFVRAPEDSPLVQRSVDSRAVLSAASLVDSSATDDAAAAPPP